MIKKKEKSAPFTNNFYLLKMVWRITPWRVIHEFIATLISFAQWVFFTVIFFKFLFGAREINRSFEEIVIFLCSTAIVMLFLNIYQKWFGGVYQKKTSQTIYFEMNRMLFEKAANVDISCYENPNFYDQYTRATAEAATRGESVLKNLSTFIASLLSVLYVLYTMFSLSIVAGILSFFPVIANFIFNKIINKYRYKKDMEDVPFNRRINYVNRVMYLQQYAKEIRLTNIYSTMKKTYDKAVEGLNKNTDKFYKPIFWLQVISSLASFSIPFQGVWLYAAYCAMVTKTILIGDFVILASAVVSTTGMLSGFANSITDSFKNANYIQNLKEFMEYIPKIDECQKGLPVTDVKELELKNVSFRYGDGENILHSISIRIKSGERIALVGHNGAGKTTLVKLLMRLYDPTEGVILLNGIDIREYDLKQYRAAISVAFQDFQVMSMSVIENVIMKNAENDEERTRALDALYQSGLSDKLSKLPKQADTILTREFDDEGAVLSGGETQKIAVARAFAKNGKILILDEPSSALDPIAEYDMNEKIMQLCESKKNEDKIAFIISHRLSSAVNIDHIYMLENGTVIEHGTHAELMAKDGAYADMFVKQAKNYLGSVVTV
mgnify:CR=1 FL=1